MKNLNRRKFSELSSTKDSYIKKLGGTERNASNKSIDDFLSTIAFSLKTKINRERVLKTSGDEKLDVKKRSFSQNNN